MKLNSPTTYEYTNQIGVYPSHHYHIKESNWHQNDPKQPPKHMSWNEKPHRVNSIVYKTIVKYIKWLENYYFEFSSATSETKFLMSNFKPLPFINTPLNMNKANIPTPFTSHSYPGSTNELKRSTNCKN